MGPKVERPGIMYQEDPGITCSVIYCRNVKRWQHFLREKYWKGLWKVWGHTVDIYLGWLDPESLNLTTDRVPAMVVDLGCQVVKLCCTGSQILIARRAWGIKSQPRNVDHIRGVCGPPYHHLGLREGSYGRCPLLVSQLLVLPWLPHLLFNGYGLSLLMVNSF